MAGLEKEAALDEPGDEDADDSREPVHIGLAARRPDLVADPRPEEPRRPRWVPDPDQVWLAARILSVGILLVWLIGWPVGMSLAESTTTGVVSIRFGYSGAVVILALTNAALILGGGYLLRASLKLEATAARLGQTVKQLGPSLRQETIREDVNVLGTEIDRALGKLMEAERQIRAQVGAIDAATATMQEGSGRVSEKLARERQALIDATAAMNAEAEAFASALAESSQRARDEASATAPDLDDKVRRLEDVSNANAEQFEALRAAMADSLERLREEPQALAHELKDGAESLREAKASLIEESEKLRSLIEQQKSRADTLGRTLAEQSAKLSKRREQPGRNLGGSWRRILDKVEKDTAEDPRPLVAKPAAADIPVTAEERERLARIHAFTLNVRRQLFGEPAAEDVQRFEAGDQLLFVRDLLARDQDELKARFTLAVSSDGAFAQDAESFLADFDTFLAPLVDGDPDTADAALGEMLASPLGQLYVLTGTATNHFS